MHVRSETRLSADQIWQRLERLEECPLIDRASLDFESDRTPPKLFLRRLPLTAPAAAELALHSRADATEVVLRLMWGPLPAPFPRAVAALGTALGALWFLLAWNGVPETLSPYAITASLIGLPLAALLYQKQGELALQRYLASLLQASPFEPKPH